MCLSFCLSGRPLVAIRFNLESLDATIGPPSNEEQIILFGVMLEICVLCTLQELRYRGYRTGVLFEGVDTYSGDTAQKRLLCETLFPFWGEAIYWQEIATFHGFCDFGPVQSALFIKKVWPIPYG